MTACAGRLPRRIEWTGGHRLPGDEAVPLDLRIDHVYLVSCKYLSKVLQNASPARLAEGLLTFRHLDDRRDWYERVAPVEYQALYRACVEALGHQGFPARVTDLDVAERGDLNMLDGRNSPDGTQDEHRDFCRAVSSETARIWNRSLRPRTGGHALAAAQDRIRPVLRPRQRRAGLHAATRRHAVGLAPELPSGALDDRGPGLRTAPGRLVGRLPRSAHRGAP